MSHENPTAEDLAREIDSAVHLLHHHLDQAAINRVILRTLRAILGFTAANYVILLGDEMAVNADGLNQSLKTLDTDADALIASHGTTETAAQAIIDNAKTQVDAIDAKVKAATPVPTPTPAPAQ